MRRLVRHALSSPPSSVVVAAARIVSTCTHSHGALCGRDVQIHNPYLATPMSIASYRMATSPTDQNNQNVLAWLDRLQASVQAAGASAGAAAFRMDARAEGHSDDSDEDGPDGGAGEPTERGSVGQPEDDEPLKDAEDRPTALPSEAVPIGLLANLALETKSKRKKKTPAKPKEGESSDDDVVRAVLPRVC